MESFRAEIDEYFWHDSQRQRSISMGRRTKCIIDLEEVTCKDYDHQAVFYINNNSGKQTKRSRHRQQATEATVIGTC